MKIIAAIFVLSCLSLCLAMSIDNVSENRKPTNEWGDTSENDIDFIERRRVFAASEPNTYQVKDLIYPMATAKKMEIVGIKHFDDADRPVEVNFVQGSLPQSDVYFVIQSELGSGINSTFVFYGRYLSN